MSFIRLSTGYVVDMEEEGWHHHLALALIGEIFLTADGDWDYRMHELLVEVRRLCDEYGLSYFAWVCEVATRLNQLVNTAEGLAPKEDSDDN
jgi:hypothetical protein